MKEFRADLHVHTCLSPCAELEMVPSAIVREARARGLEMIGICDHNTTENVAAVTRAAEWASVAIVPGMEITSREEVHVLGLFRDAPSARRMQAAIYEHLAGENDAETFGPQVVVDEWDQPIDLNMKLLIGATDLSLEDIVDSIHAQGGLAVASHIDRQSFGILGQLGFIPEGLQLDGVEVSAHAPFRTWEDFPVITSSDAHRLDDIGKCWTSFFVEDTSLDEIEKAMRREDGRRMVPH